MSTFSDLGSVICHIDATTKAEAIGEVIDKCTIFHSLPDLSRFKRAVLNREAIETTGIGHGIAIAHGKIRNLTHVQVGLGLSECGIEYDAKDGMPVHFLFVIASSPTRQFEYIRTLSALLRTVRSAEVRNELLRLDENYECPDPISSQGDSLMRMLADQHFSWIWHRNNQ
ncbi:MAG: PTS sugar transporter subunit IIA [Sphaerochaetaceae bacterium]|nr:PTS sugar transporter subunit IIA [Sphaerochaetaceae bacterium]MDD3942009.1 PTS sugar transporter subunit IIA [Sphaerochaetaceae bacterium]MDX9940371.1 PTS sugar transporter subunit IIA [Sphaerochaetaceae bacterium]